MPEDIDKDSVSPHIHAKVGKAKKMRWMKYAQKEFRGDLSSLIIEAVDKEISDHWVLESETATGDIDVDLSGVL